MNGRPVATAVPCSSSSATMTSGSFVRWIAVDRCAWNRRRAALCLPARWARICSRPWRRRGIHVGANGYSSAPSTANRSAKAAGPCCTAAVKARSRTSRGPKAARPRHRQHHPGRLRPPVPRRTRRACRAPRARPRGGADEPRTEPPRARGRSATRKRKWMTRSCSAPRRRASESAGRLPGSWTPPRSVPQPEMGSAGGHGRADVASATDLLLAKEVRAGLQPRTTPRLPA
jgi:hypothetical protein